MPAPGRNDLCPCGSGRKYKHCHLRAGDADDAARLRLRSAEGALVPALFKYAARRFGRQFFDEAVEEFFVWDHVPENIDDSREMNTTFDPFLVFGFVPDSAERQLPAGWPLEPIALHFLHENPSAVPAFQREFIVQACKSPASFFVIEATEPGRSVDLKDILTGRQFHVLEQSASRTFQRGDLTFVRVVTAGGASIMIGASPWIIPPDWHVHLLDFRDRASPRRMMTRADLVDYDIELREMYHQIADALAKPRLPQLQNTDGDPLEMTTVIYEVSLPTPEAFERLRSLATLGGDEHIDEETFDVSGVLTAVTMSWVKAGNRKNKAWDNTILGTLRLDGSTLTVEVNSAKRRARIAREVAKRLGRAVREVDSRVVDVVNELEARRKDDSEIAAESPAPVDLERTPEMRALEAEIIRQHWEGWLDTRIPALGNKTPRQAARTPRGRERLEALLTDYERTGLSPQNALMVDVGELRRRLGLA